MVWADSPARRPGDAAIDEQALFRRYPRVYHVADKGSWPSIRRRGLLSTSAVLDLCMFPAAKRSAIERQWRPGSITVLADSDVGPITIRDQLPIRPDLLRRCLDDAMSPADWYAFLNGKVFFWTDWRRVERLRRAAPYANRPHRVLVVDTRALVASHRERISLSPINSGAVAPAYARRGLSTFAPIDEYARRDVAELVVDHSVPDIAELVVDVETLN